MGAREWVMPKYEGPSDFSAPSNGQHWPLNSFVDRYIPGYVFFGDSITQGIMSADCSRKFPPWIGNGLAITIGETRDCIGTSDFWSDPNFLQRLGAFSMWFIDLILLCFAPDWPIMWIDHACSLKAGILSGSAEGIPGSKVWIFSRVSNICPIIKTPNPALSLAGSLFQSCEDPLLLSSGFSRKRFWS
jgi:hypothetical protein